MYTILHVFDDDKFFDLTCIYYESLENVNNLFYYYTPQKSYRFKKIKSSGKICVFNNWKDYVSLFSDDSIDAIYFQGLCDREHYKLINYIGQKQKVIWWSFGAELYNIDGLPPLIRIELLKPLTSKYYKKYRFTKPKQLLKRLYFLFATPYYSRLRRRFLKRVDYYTPVLTIERQLLMEQFEGFKAKPFMELCGPTLLRDFPFKFHTKACHVLVGNSLTFSNNYLDVIEIIRKISLEKGRKYIFPICYGSDYGGIANFKKISMMPENQTFWLESFLPVKEYYELFNNVTHAVFGFIRQQGIGNVEVCLRTGVKVYLYKDSIVYKHYYNSGYKVFTIEDDLTTESLASCLSEEDAKINHKLSLEHYRHAYREVVEKEIESIFKS